MATTGTGTTMARLMATATRTGPLQPGTGRSSLPRGTSWEGPHAVRPERPGRGANWPHHRLALGLLAFSLVVTAPAAARGQAIDGYLGLLMAGGRPAGLAGAYVGLGEGIVGEPTNPAAVGQRNRRLERGWDWDGTVTWYFPSASDLSHTDVGNDGQSDGGLSGFGNLMVGLSGQYGRFGAGMMVQALNFDQLTPSLATQRVGFSTTTLSLAWSAWRDQLVVGAGFANRVGTFQWIPPGGVNAEREASYGALTYRLGALWRPRGEAWRLGVALQSGKVTGITEVVGSLPAGAPTSFEFPWILSVGGSCWIGHNARRYNEPSPVALAEHPEWGPGPAWDPGDGAPLLLTAQLDVVGASPGAVSLTSALDGTSTPSGAKASLVPRAGAEWEWFPDRFRVRGGLYVEPSRTGNSPRPHGTAGLELRVPFWPWDLQLAGGADVARGFFNYSISVGLWSSLAPPPPTAAAPSGP